MVIYFIYGRVSTTISWFDLKKKLFQTQFASEAKPKDVLVLVIRATIPFPAKIDHGAISIPASSAVNGCTIYSAIQIIVMTFG